MNKVISCCGLDCSTCEARIATLNNDDKLREETAKKWSEMYHAGISADMINCVGCREEGVKIGHWNDCEIRKCVHAKGYSTCGECVEMESCQIVAFVHKHVPEAITNLKNLNL